MQYKKISRVIRLIKNLYLLKPLKDFTSSGAHLICRVEELHLTARNISFCFSQLFKRLLYREKKAQILLKILQTIFFFVVFLCLILRLSRSWFTYILKSLTVQLCSVAKRYFMFSEWPRNTGFQDTDESYRAGTSSAGLCPGPEFCTVHSFSNVEGTLTTRRRLWALT